MVARSSTGSIAAGSVGWPPQVRVTDAVHGALGPIVAPTVTGHRGQPWTVTMRLEPRDFGAAGRLVELAERALGSEGGPVRVVLATRAA